MRTRFLLPTVLAGFAVALGACDQAPEARASQFIDPDQSSATEMVVYKSPTCGCCDLWVDHAEEHGFTVDAIDIVEYDALVAKKREHGIDMDLGSCHTTLVAGYVVEGHVPADVIQRLLHERPDIRGLAVPGMPIGSPGMEGPGPQPYQVIAIAHDGSRSVYQTVDPR